MNEDAMKCFADNARQLISQLERGEVATGKEMYECQKSIEALTTFMVVELMGSTGSAKRLREEYCWEATRKKD